MSAPARYDFFSRALHWLTAPVVGIAFVLGPAHFGRLLRNGVAWMHSAGRLVHGVLFMAVAGLHAAAAVYHQWILRDGVLAAMLPSKCLR